MTEHWLDQRRREKKPLSLEGNVPRMSAETLLKLNQLKNELLGTDLSLYEANLIAEEKNTQTIIE